MIRFGLERSRRNGSTFAAARLHDHFAPFEPHDLVTASRTFPATSQVDLQRALDTYFRENGPVIPSGLHSAHTYETLTTAHLLADGHQAVSIGPLQHREIDVGEDRPALCLVRGLWLSRFGDLPCSVLITPEERYGQSAGVHLEIAVPPGDQGAQCAASFLDEIGRRIAEAGSYRGKVLSLESMPHYGGQAGSVRVHRLRTVGREEVILPASTLRLLERNIHEFVRRRDELHALGLGVRKGLLFYGPPGTGKTHTIHYLAGQLADHTTLLITAEQVGLLDEYFQLARFLEPSMVVIEDVDLIARAREEMRGPCEESLLNKLLNEMDGLREDARVLFVLTTNRPDQLEAALASRPGRIDQAIEFPLPDEDGRRKLIRLYGRDLRIPDDLITLVSRRTKGASAAFIKELMRRSAQFFLEEGCESLEGRHVDAALEEMLFSGGTLNARLLGGASTGAGAAQFAQPQDLR